MLWAGAHVPAWAQGALASRAADEPTWIAELPAMASAVSVVFGAYLLGSLLAAQLVARRAGIDITRVGSGNPGATNVRRALGRRAGQLVLALDAIKGLLPTLLARALFGFDSPITAATGVAVVLGHIFPLWYRLRGGKGAATSLGVLLALDPWVAIAALGAYFGLKRFSRRTSVGSIGSTLLAAAAMNARHGTEPAALTALILAALVLVRHEANLRRLLRGEEPPT